MRPSQQATTGASAPSGPPKSAADSRSTSPWRGAHPHAAGEGHDLRGADDQQTRRRLFAAASVDEPERPAAHRRRAGGARVLESQFERLHRREVAQSQEGGRGGQSSLDRVLGRRVDTVGDRQEGGQRRQADQLRLGEQHAVLGRDVAHGLPDQPQRGDREVEDVHRDLGATQFLDPEAVGLDLRAARRPIRGRGARSAWPARRRREARLML